MALRDLEYQARVLSRLDDYLTELATWKSNADQVAELARQNPTLHLPIPDFSAETWEAMRASGRVLKIRVNRIEKPTKIRPKSASGMLS